MNKLFEHRREEEQEIVEELIEALREARADWINWVSQVMNCSTGDAAKFEEPTKWQTLIKKAKGENNG